MPRHKHADVIHAWAEGEEIEQRNLDSDRWFPVKAEHPIWYAHTEYRIKPKIVKREGWVNVYPSMSYAAYVGYVFDTQKEADRNKDDGRQATVRIEWEEEE